MLLFPGHENDWKMFIPPKGEISQSHSLEKIMYRWKNKRGGKKPSNQNESINMEDLVSMALEKEIHETKEKYTYTKKKKKQTNKQKPKVRLHCTLISAAVKRRGCFSLLC